MIVVLCNCGSGGCYVLGTGVANVLEERFWLLSVVRDFVCCMVCCMKLLIRCPLLV